MHTFNSSLTCARATSTVSSFILLFSPRYQQQVSQVDAVGDQIAMLQQQRDANSSNQDYRNLEQQALKLHKQMQGLVSAYSLLNLGQSV